MSLHSAWNMFVLVLVILAIGIFQQGFQWNPWEDGAIRTELAFASIFSLVAWGTHATTLYRDLSQSGAWWLGILTAIPLFLIALHTRWFANWSGDILTWSLSLLVPAMIVYFTRRSIWQLALGLLGRRLKSD